MYNCNTCEGVSGVSPSSKSVVSCSVESSPRTLQAADLTRAHEVVRRLSTVEDFPQGKAKGNILFITVLTRWPIINAPQQLYLNQL